MAPPADTYVDKNGQPSGDGAVVSAATTAAINLVNNVILGLQNLVRAPALTTATLAKQVGAGFGAAAAMGSPGAGWVAGLIAPAMDQAYLRRLIYAYFKANDPKNVQYILSVFNAVKNELNTKTAYTVDKSQPFAVHGRTDLPWGLYSVAGTGRISQTIIGPGFLADAAEQQPGTIIHEAMHRMTFGSFRYARSEKYFNELVSSQADWDSLTTSQLMKWNDTYTAFAMAFGGKQYFNMLGALPEDVQRSQSVLNYRELGWQLLYAQQRLKELGLYSGPTDGKLNQDFDAAMRKFAKAQGLGLYMDQDWKNRPDLLLNALAKAKKP